MDVASESKPIERDGFEDLCDHIRTPISVFVRTDLDIRVTVAVDDYLTKRLLPILEQQESEIARTANRTFMMQLQTGVDLLGNPLGRAQPPLPGDHPNSEAPRKYVVHRMGFAPPLKTDTGMPDGNEEDVPRVLQLLPVPSQPGSNGDPDDSSSGDGSSDRNNRGHRE